MSFDQLNRALPNIVVAGERGERRTIDAGGDEILVNTVVSYALISVPNRTVFENPEHAVDLAELDRVPDGDLDRRVTLHEPNSSAVLDQ